MQGLSLGSCSFSLKGIRGHPKCTQRRRGAKALLHALLGDLGAKSTAEPNHGSTAMINQNARRDSGSSALQNSFSESKPDA